jgi:hypothetical protein
MRVLQKFSGFSYGPRVMLSTERTVAIATTCSSDRPSPLLTHNNAGKRSRNCAEPW